MSRYDYNSSKNLAIKDRFVQCEVIACISDMAEYLFGYDGDKYADWDERSYFRGTNWPKMPRVTISPVFNLLPIIIPLRNLTFSSYLY